MVNYFRLRKYEYIIRTLNFEKDTYFSLQKTIKNAINTILK